MFKGLYFKIHTNPIQSDLQGWIENDQGIVVAYVKLNGEITQNIRSVGDESR